MPYKVLVVDDSSFFRRRVTDILNADPNLIVVDVAVNGIEAVEKAKILKPDVITMDIEMPRLNGIDAVKQIMRDAPTSIIMFSSLTHKGARTTLEALDAGALDFLPKKFAEIANNTADAGSLLRQRVIQLARKNTKIKPIQIDVKTKSNTVVKDLVNLTRTNKLRIKASPQNYKIISIGTSTGGPIALQKILTQLPENFPVPIIIVQHMPATFTKAFANRLNNLCKITIQEASNGDQLIAGNAYLAPGGKQMIINGSASQAKLKIIDDTSERIAFKPSVDVTFASTAKVFGGSVLGIILTGMGSDGKDGCRLLKNNGATIWSQDEESCVVYGMPQAVASAGLVNEVLALDEVAPSILKVFDLK